MFLPIIHNQIEGEANFKLFQSYNKLIATKPTGGNNLAEKVELQRQWKKACSELLEQCKLANK